MSNRIIDIEMMTNKSISLIFGLILLCNFHINGQELSGNDAQENLYKLGGMAASEGIVRKFDNRYEGVKGSPFWFENLTTGSVVFENNQQIENARLKYNVYEDELILNKPNVGDFYVPKSSVKSFQLLDEQSNSYIHFIKAAHPRKETESQYYRIVVPGNIELLEFTKVVFEKADFEGGYSNNKRYDEFKKYPGFYYKTEIMTQPQKLKLNPGGISKIFPDHNNQVKEFILDNGLECSVENDLSKIFEFYNHIK